MILKSKHIEVTLVLIENRHILESHDPDHILNKRFSTGQTPMYTAAKNGNLNAIEMLVQYGANHLYPSHVIMSQFIDTYIQLGK